MRQTTIIKKNFYKIRQIFFYKVLQVIQNVTEVYHKVRQVLQSVSGITKCDTLLSQNVSGIQSLTDCYYKVH